MKIYTIRDKKAEYYMEPQLYRTSHDAVRACKNSVNNDQNGLFAKNAEDFSLFEIGSFDEMTGNITILDKKHVCDLVDLRELE